MLQRSQNCCQLVPKPETWHLSQPKAASPEGVILVPRNGQARPAAALGWRHGALGVQRREAVPSGAAWLQNASFALSNWETCTHRHCPVKPQHRQESSTCNVPSQDLQLLVFVSNCGLARLQLHLQLLQLLPCMRVLRFFTHAVPFFGFELLQGQTCSFHLCDRLHNLHMVLFNLLHGGPIIQSSLTGFNLTLRKNTPYMTMSLKRATQRDRQVSKHMKQARRKGQGKPPAGRCILFQR